MSLAFIFPGQGSQAVGMGVDLAETFSAAREVFQEGDDALGQKLFALMRDGPETDLTLTENAQPALMAVSLAVSRVLEKEFGVGVDRAAFVAGHSLGEYSALAAAGAISLADTARLLKLRGQAMQRAVPVGEGAMASLIGPKTDVALAEAAAAAGAEVGGGDSKDIAAMHEYGMQLGLAFQIMDDALDYAADAADMGKNTGDDFADQKITMPTIIAWQQGDAEERAFWQRTLGEANFAEGDLTIAQTLLAKHDAITLSLAAARDYVKQASDGVLAHCAKRGAGGQDASTMIGRAYIYGLGAMGQNGVRKALEIIQNELDLTMAFCGKTSLANVERDILFSR